MSKLRIKVSGCMRSMAGAESFCAIRSYLATVARHGTSALDALTRAFQGNPLDPRHHVSRRVRKRRPPRAATGTYLVTNDFSSLMPVVWSRSPQRPLSTATATPSWLREIRGSHQLLLNGTESGQVLQVETKPMEAPIFIGELELTEPISSVSLPARQDGLFYTGVRLLVRIQRLPVGYAFLRPDMLAPEEIATQVWQQLSAEVNAQRARFKLTPLETLLVNGIPVEEALADDVIERPLITVVVCTRDRPDSAMVTLRTLANLHYQPVEIVVVDNAPSSDATKNAYFEEFGDDSRFRYVREPRPGLSCARNRGLQEASADIVAFTDDDVRVDPWWLDGIMRGFRTAPDIACVTGLPATAELENAMQLYFHIRYGYGASCEPRIFDLAAYPDDSPLYPYLAVAVGVGANFAVSRRIIKEIGGFDEALGAGTPCGGGEDINIFSRIILSGNRLAYEPSAVVWHVHRPSLNELSKQMRAYGSGFTAALAAIVWASPRARRELPAKVAVSLVRMVRLTSRVRDESAVSAPLLKQEISGQLIGPWLYLKGRRNLRGLARKIDSPLPPLTGCKYSEVP
jgi:GT2 family glycosyltransferase